MNRSYFEAPLRAWLGHLKVTKGPEDNLFTVRYTSSSNGGCSVTDTGWFNKKSVVDRHLMVELGVGSLFDRLINVKPVLGGYFHGREAEGILVDPDHLIFTEGIQVPQLYDALPHVLARSA